MTIEELQQLWNAVPSKPRSHQQIRRIMYRPRVIGIRNISRKEIMRFTTYALLAVVLTISFDLLNDLSTAIPLLWGVFLLVDEYVGLRYMRFLPQDGAIDEALQRSLVLMQQAQVWSRIIHLAMWVIVVAVLHFYLQLDMEGTAWMALQILPVAVLVYWWSSRKWKQMMSKVNVLLSELKEFNDEVELAQGN